MALERPEISPFKTPSRFVDGDYLYRFGFLKSEKHERFNPGGLPVGFATHDDNVTTEFSKKPWAKGASRTVVGVEDDLECFRLNCVNVHKIENSTLMLTVGIGDQLDRAELRHRLKAHFGDRSEHVSVVEEPVARYVEHVEDAKRDLL